MTRRISSHFGDDVVLAVMEKLTKFANA